MSDKLVRYKLRETPSDPNSDVLLKHEMHISEKSRSGNEITWTVDKLTFDQPLGGDWTDSSPGLSDWKTAHADIDAPVAIEFTSPPAMSGTATSNGIGDALTYAFTPGTCDSSESQMYGGAVTCAEYLYKKGSTTIAEEEEEEPTEVDLPDPPS